MTGIELIAKERREQIEKHGYTTQEDVKTNCDGQLQSAVIKLLLKSPNSSSVAAPIGWDVKKWKKMCNKSEIERLIIAGALIAAEIDRLLKIKEVTIDDVVLRFRYYMSNRKNPTAPVATHVAINPEYKKNFIVRKTHAFTGAGMETVIETIYAKNIRVDEYILEILWSDNVKENDVIFFTSES